MGIKTIKLLGLQTLVLFCILNAGCKNPNVKIAVTPKPSSVISGSVSVSPSLKPTPAPDGSTSQNTPILTETPKPSPTESVSGSGGISLPSQSPSVAPSVVISVSPSPSPSSAGTVTGSTGGSTGSGGGGIPGGTTTSTTPSITGLSSLVKDVNGKYEFNQPNLNLEISGTKFGSDKTKVIVTFEGNEFSPDGTNLRSKQLIVNVNDILSVNDSKITIYVNTLPTRGTIFVGKVKVTINGVVSELSVKEVILNFTGGN